MTGPFIELIRPGDGTGPPEILINVAHVHTITLIPGGHGRVVLCSGTVFDVVEDPTEIIAKINDAFVAQAARLHGATAVPSLSLASTESGE